MCDRYLAILEMVPQTRTLAVSRIVRQSHGIHTKPVSVLVRYIYGGAIHAWFRFEGLGYARVAQMRSAGGFMRASILLHNQSSRIIPFDYQYPLACWLLRCFSLGDFELARDLHASKGFKPYCFSNLLPMNGSVKRNGLDFTRARVLFSSPDPDFVRTLAEGLLNKPEFKLMRRPFVVEEIRLLPSPSIGSCERIRTLSPVYVKTARETQSPVGRDGCRAANNFAAARPPLREWDLYPSDGKFYDNLHRNLVERFEDFYGRPPSRDDFEILDVDEVRPKRVVIGSGHRATYRRCAHFTFTAAGNSELLQFMYDAGLGEKQAMGFGCVELAEQQDPRGGEQLD